MRCVVQRVLSSSVEVDGKTVSEIGEGLNVLVGIGPDDNDRDCDYIAEKLTGLRIFEDEEGKTNLSMADIVARGRSCGVILISQFTLMGDVRHGKRPSFTGAAAPEIAEGIYLRLVEAVEKICGPLGIYVGRGVFRADMKVKILNDGPFTVLLDSKKLF